MRSVDGVCLRKCLKPNIFLNASITANTLFNFVFILIQLGNAFVVLTHGTNAVVACSALQHV